MYALGKTWRGNFLRDLGRSRRLYLVMLANYARSWGRLDVQSIGWARGIFKPDVVTWPVVWKGAVDGSDERGAERLESILRA
jgi:hypothetical protein